MHSYSFARLNHSPQNYICNFRITKSKTVIGRQKESNHRCESVDMYLQLLQNCGWATARGREKKRYSYTRLWMKINYTLCTCENGIKCFAMWVFVCLCACACTLNEYNVAAHNCLYTSTCMLHMKQNELRWIKNDILVVGCAKYTYTSVAFIARVCVKQSMECIWDAQNRLHCIA